MAHFDRTDTDTYVLIYTTPRDEANTPVMLESYWPTYEAAMAERDEVTALGATNAHVESLAELDAIDSGVVVEYFAARDTGAERAREEDRAMAHESIYRGPSLEAARAALVAYMNREVSWLAREDGYRDGRALRRAADIADAIDQVAALRPDETVKWSRVSVKPVGLVFSITRVERDN